MTVPSLLPRYDFEGQECKVKIVFGILLLAISASLQFDVCAATKQERL